MFNSVILSGFFSFSTNFYCHFSTSEWRRGKHHHRSEILWKCEKVSLLLCSWQKEKEILSSSTIGCTTSEMKSWKSQAKVRDEDSVKPSRKKRKVGRKIDFERFFAASAVLCATFSFNFIQPSKQMSVLWPRLINFKVVNEKSWKNFNWKIILWFPNQFPRVFFLIPIFTISELCVVLCSQSLLEWFSLLSVLIYKKINSHLIYLTFVLILFPYPNKIYTLSYFVLNPENIKTVIIQNTKKRKKSH